MLFLKRRLVARKMGTVPRAVRHERNAWTVPVFSLGKHQPYSQPYRAAVLVAGHIRGGDAICSELTRYVAGAGE